MQNQTPLGHHKRSISQTNVHQEVRKVVFEDSQKLERSERSPQQHGAAHHPVVPPYPLPPYPLLSQASAPGGLIADRSDSTDLAGSSSASSPATPSASNISLPSFATVELSDSTSAGMTFFMLAAHVHIYKNAHVHAQVPATSACNLYTSRVAYVNTHAQAPTKARLLAKLQLSVPTPIASAHCSSVRYAPTCARKLTQLFSLSSPPLNANALHKRARVKHNGDPLGASQQSERYRQLGARGSARQRYAIVLIFILPFIFFFCFLVILFFFRFFSLSAQLLIHCHQTATSSGVDLGPSPRAPKRMYPLHFVYFLHLFHSCILTTNCAIKKTK